MNRAQRRLAGFRNRPSGLFLGELQRRGLNREYQTQLRSQIEQETNGKPIDPEVAAKMTKAKESENLFQVMVTDALSKQQIPMGPMASRDACGLWAEAINRQITKGQRKDWSKAEVFPMTRILEGAA
jgi:hypothetical protein